MVQVPRDIGTITRWSYNLSKETISLRIFILVLISSFYLIIHMGMIEEDNIC